MNMVPVGFLRLARDGRSLAAEAEIMRFVGQRGYPVPGVHDAGQGYLIMDRLTGPTMLESALRHPPRIGSYGHLLAQLHVQLHQIEAPDWLFTEAGARGDRPLHRDLHPLNVLMTKEGPMVIDWANAARGNPAYDVARTWVLFSTADAQAICWRGRRRTWREGSFCVPSWETSTQLRRVPSSPRRWSTGWSIGT